MMGTTAADQTRILDSRHQGLGGWLHWTCLTQDDEVMEFANLSGTSGASDDETAGRQSANHNQERRQTLVSAVDDSSLANRRVNIITQRLQ